MRATFGIRQITNMYTKQNLIDALDAFSTYLDKGLGQLVANDLQRMKDYLTQAKAMVNTWEITTIPNTGGGGGSDPGGSGGGGGGGSTSPRPKTGLIWGGDTDLHGKPLPARPNVNVNLARTKQYGLTITNEVIDMQGGALAGVTSCGAILKGTAGLKNFIVYGSDNDGLKGDGGPMAGNLTITNGHIFALGFAAGSHADGFQCRGNMLSVVFDGIYFDIPAIAGDGSQSNACIIVDSVQGPNGTFTVKNSILRGGNRAIMMTKKNAGDGTPGRFVFENTAFVVEKTQGYSPQFTLLQPGYESSCTFDENCGVYELRSDGLCYLITKDVANFDLAAWQASH